MWKFLCIQEDYMKILVLTSLAVILFLIQILAGRTSKIMSVGFYVCVKLCNLFCNYSEYKSKKKKSPFVINCYTGKQNIFLKTSIL